MNREIRKRSIWHADHRQSLSFSFKLRIVLFLSNYEWANLLGCISFQQDSACIIPLQVKENKAKMNPFPFFLHPQKLSCICVCSVWWCPWPVLWPDEAFWSGRIPQQHALLVPWWLRGPRVLQHRGMRPHSTLRLCCCLFIWHLERGPTCFLNSGTKWKGTLSASSLYPTATHGAPPTRAHTHTHLSIQVYMHTLALHVFIKRQSVSCFLNSWREGQGVSSGERLVCFVQTEDGLTVLLATVMLPC